MTYSLKEILLIDRQWTNQFAENYGWEKHVLKDPEDDLCLFFEHLSGNTILDVGCGWGRYVFRFLDEGLEYTGIDHATAMLHVARTTNPDVTFIEGSFQELPFPSDHFDGLWSCCSLAGLPKKYLVEVLREHWRVLRPGGILYIVMSAVCDSDEGMYINDDGSPSIYQAHYDLDEFYGHVEQVGFVTVRADYRWHCGSFYVLCQKPTEP